LKRFARPALETLTSTDGPMVVQRDQWAKTAMRYWPRETLAACKDNKSYRIAHGLE
jgi:hypothetical protein